MPHACAHTENLDALCRVATRIAGAALGARSLAELGASVHEQIKSLMPAAQAYLAIWEEDEQGGYIHFPYWVDSCDPMPPLKVSGSGITEYVIRTGEALFADSSQLERMELAGHFSVLGSRPRQWYGVPLKRSAHEVIGVFAVQSYEGDPPLEPRHGSILYELSPAIAAAVRVYLAEQAGRGRDALLNAAADIAQLLLTDLGWKRHIDETLGLIGRASESSRAYLFSVERTSEGKHLATQLAEWAREGIEPQIDNPQLQAVEMEATGFERWVLAFQKGESISGPVLGLPPAERDFLGLQKIRSIHEEPIHVEGRFWGFIGLDDCVRARVWSRAEREALRICSKIIGQAIHRELAHQQFELHHTALSVAANGIVITDVNGRIIWVNDAFLRMTGYERSEILCHTLDLLTSGKHDQAFYRNMWETILRGEVWQGEIVNRRKNGSLYTEDMTITPVLGADGKPTHFVAIKQDITERVELQHQLLLAQKLESVGRLAGGIAHDFNNILQAITGFSAILLSEIHESDPRRNDVLEIERAAQRAAGLTRQLLSFSRRQKMDLTSLQVNDIIHGAEKMLRRLLPENIAIELCLAAELPPVRGDAGQLEQALVNLAINARDAMPEGGRLRISTSMKDLPADRIPAVEGARPGRHVLIEVSDTGHGIPPEIMDRIFEPFFSTKDPAHGTGLGLPAVYGIVRQHNGFIEVNSRPGAGARFSLFLPAAGDAQRPKTSAAPADAASSSSDNLRGKGEHILVVEDEEGVRELTLRVLANHNYRVTAARDVAEAQKCLAAPHAHVDLLFSDVVLPDGNGLDLGEQARRQHPHLKVVLTSGYTRERDRWHERIARLDGFLAKPYPTPALLRLLRRALDVSAP